jgi:hypothetical protein
MDSLPLSTSDNNQIATSHDEGNATAALQDDSFPAAFFV